MTEVGILHTLSHPNVTRFYCWYETTNHLWVVTEVCVGGDLRTVLAQDGVLGEPAVAAFSRHIAMGLCYCHSQGIVYCDLKPTNVLLAGDGALKLCDFGLAQRAAEVRGPGGARGESRGTPFYMAPELLGQDGVASFASDLYSLGCVMYELATGHPPFLSQSFGQLVTEIMTKPVPMPEGVSPPFWDLLTRLLEKDPLKRITWAELAGHPFWRLCGLPGLDPVVLPPQPAFERYVALRTGSGQLAPAGGPGAVTRERSRDSMRTSSANSAHSAASGGVTSALMTPAASPSPAPRLPARSPQQPQPQQQQQPQLALKVKRNMERAAGAEAGFRSGAIMPASGGDVTLANTDVEVDFGDHPEASPVPSPRTGGAASPSPKNSPRQADHIVEGDRAIVRTRNRKTPERQAQVGAAAAAAAAAAASSASASASTNANISSTSSSKRPTVVTSPSRPISAPQTQTQQTTTRSPIAQRPATSSTTSQKPKQAQPPQQQQQQQQPPPQIFQPQAGQVGRSGGGPSPVAQDLVFSDMDSTVWPIMSKASGSGPAYEPSKLPFPCHPPATVLAMGQVDLEGFLTAVYRTIGGSSPSEVKLQALGYFETLCRDTALVNVLIDSSLATLFSKMLKVYKSAPLRARLATVMGLLIRHASDIGDELAGSGLMDTLVELTADSAPAVRRDAAGCLGELLFYIAATNSEPGADQAATPWVVAPAVYAQLVWCLRPGGDEAVQQAVVRTIENVAAVSADHARRFASSREVVTLLVGLYRGAASESLRSGALSALARLVRHSRGLLAPTVEALGGLEGLAEVLREPGSSTSLAGINLLNMLLLQQQQQGGSSASEPVGLGEASVSLISNLTRMLEHHLSVGHKCKALIGLHLLCLAGHRYALQCCDARLLALVERFAAGDRDQYGRQCALLVITGLASLVPGIAAGISSEVARACGPPGSNSLSTLSPPSSPLDSPRVESATPRSLLLRLLLHLVTNAQIRARAVNGPLLVDLSSWLLAAGFATGSAARDLMRTLLLVTEAISQHSAVLVANKAPVLSHLLPALSTLLRSDSGDTRFLCLKILFDVLQLLITSPQIYPVDPAAAAAAADAPNSMASVAELDALVVKSVLPAVATVIRNERPVPIAALKLLLVLVDRNPVFASVLERLGLTSVLLSALRLGHENYSVHNIRLLSILIATAPIGGGSTTLGEVCARLKSCLAGEAASGMAPFLEALLDLMYSLLYRTHDTMREASSPMSRSQSPAGRASDAVAELVELTPTLVKLMAHPDVAAVAEGAVRCLQLLLRLFPDQTAAMMVRDEPLAVLCRLLEGPGATDQQLLRKRTVKAISQAAVAAGPAGRARMRVLINPLRAIAAQPNAGEHADGANVLLQQIERS